MMVKRRWKKTQSPTGPEQCGLSVHRLCDIGVGPVLHFECGVVALFVSAKGSRALLKCCKLLLLVVF